MDFEILERAWRSNANRPSDAAAAYLMEEMMQTLRKRRNDVRGIVVFAGLALIVQTGLIVHALRVQRVMDAGREWGALLMIAVAWAALVWVGLHFRRHLLAFPDPYVSTAATLRALADENRATMQRMRFMGVAGLLFVLATALSLGQLVAVDKMTPGNVRDFSILFGGGFLAGATYGLWRYFRVLKPESMRLQRLLQEYRD